MYLLFPSRFPNKVRGITSVSIVDAGGDRQVKVSPEVDLTTFWAI